MALCYPKQFKRTIGWNRQLFGFRLRRDDFVTTKKI